MAARKPPASGDARRLMAKSPQRGEASPRVRKDKGTRRVRMLRALALLSGGKTPREVATEMGVEPCTVYDWMHDPQIAEALRESRSRAVETARARLELQVHDSIDALQEIQKDGGKEDAARVKAADVLLSRVISPSQRLEVTHIDELTAKSDEELDAEFEADAVAYLRGKGWRPPEEVEIELEAKGWKRPE